MKWYGLLFIIRREYQVMRVCASILNEKLFRYLYQISALHVTIFWNQVYYILCGELLCSIKIDNLFVVSGIIISVIFRFLNCISSRSPNAALLRHKTSSQHGSTCAVSDFTYTACNSHREVTALQTVLHVIQVFTK